MSSRFHLFFGLTFLLTLSDCSFFDYESSSPTAEPKEASRRLNRLFSNAQITGRIARIGKRRKDRSGRIMRTLKLVDLSIGGDHPCANKLSAVPSVRVVTCVKRCRRGSNLPRTQIPELLTEGMRVVASGLLTNKCRLANSLSQRNLLALRRASSIAVAPIEVPAGSIPIAVPADSIPQISDPNNNEPTESVGNTNPEPSPAETSKNPNPSIPIPVPVTDPEPAPTPSEPVEVEPAPTPVGFPEPNLPSRPTNVPYCEAINNRPLNGLTVNYDIASGRLVVNGSPGSDVIIYSGNKNDEGELAPYQVNLTDDPCRAPVLYRCVSQLEIHAGEGNDQLLSGGEIPGVSKVLDGGVGNDVINRPAPLCPAEPVEPRPNTAESCQIQGDRPLQGMTVNYDYLGGNLTITGDNSNSRIYVGNPNGGGLYDIAVTDDICNKPLVIYPCIANVSIDGGLGEHTIIVPSLNFAGNFSTAGQSTDMFIGSLGGGNVFLGGRNVTYGAVPASYLTCP